MKNYFVLAYLLMVCSTALADSIYKWTDSSGKVHYGDRNVESSNAVKIVVKAPEVPSSKADAVAPESEGRSGDTGTAATSDMTNLQKCLAMARTMVNKVNTSPPEVRADSKNLLDLCPGTAYECVTYIERPESNNCKAVPMMPNGRITNNRVYRR